MQDVFLLHTQCFQDGLQIQCDSDQDKGLTDDECMNKELHIELIWWSGETECMEPGQHQYSELISHAGGDILCILSLKYICYIKSKFYISNAAEGSPFLQCHC